VAGIDFELLAHDHAEPPLPILTTRYIFSSCVSAMKSRVYADGLAAGFDLRADAVHTAGALFERARVPGYICRRLSRPPVTRTVNGSRLK